MKCGVCGSESEGGGQYCPRCGAIIAEPIRPDDPRLVTAEDDLQKAIRSRRASDAIIEPLWAFVPLILSIVGAIVFFAIFVSRIQSLVGTTGSTPNDVLSPFRDAFIVIIFFSVASIAIFVLITYKLVKRRNDHFSREHEVKMALVKLVRSAAWSPERLNNVHLELRIMEQGLGGYTRRDPVFWSFAIALGATSVFGILTFFWLPTSPNQAGIIFLSIGLSALIGFVSFVLMIYMFYWLGKDVKEHDLRWFEFSHYARKAMSKLGFPYPSSLGYGISSLPDRSFAIYLILTIFFSPFVYYWWYTLIKDPNDHFRSQWVFEDETITAIRGIVNPPIRA